MGGHLHLLFSRWHWLQKPKFGCLHLLIRVFPPFDQGFSAFWSASDTDFKNLSSNFHWWGSPPFDQLSDTDFKNLSLGVYTFWSCVSAFWSGCLHLLISKWHWLQKPMFGCLHLWVSLLFDQDVSTFWSARWHWLQTPKFGWLHLLISVSLLFDQGVSAFWSTSDTDFKNLSPTLDVAVSTPWWRSGCFQPFDQGFSAFWSASDTDFKNLSSNFHWWGVVSTFWSTSDTDFKNLTLGVYTLWSGCFHLWMRVPLPLISKSHWLQKPKFQHSPGGLSPTFDQQVILTCKWYWLQKPKFGCLHLLISVSLPFDQGVSTFRSASDTDFKNLSLGVSAFWYRCLCLLISKWHWLQKPKFGHLHPLIRVFPPFDQQMTLTSNT